LISGGIEAFLLKHKELCEGEDLDNEYDRIYKENNKTRVPKKAMGVKDVNHDIKMV